MQSPPPAVFHDKYQWEIWENTAGKSDRPVPKRSTGYWYLFHCQRFNPLSNPRWNGRIPRGPSKPEGCEGWELMIMSYQKLFKKYQKAKMKSHFELKRTALQRPATTTRPRRMDTKESWTPSRYLEGWRKYWKTLKPFESSATYVFATWTPRSKAVPRTRSIWFQRLRSQSSEDLLVLHYTHHIRR